MKHPATYLKTAPAKAGAVLCAAALITAPVAWVASQAAESYAEGTEALAQDAVPYELEEASGIPGFSAAMAFLNGNDVPLDRLKEVDLAALGSLYPDLAAAIAQHIAQAEGAPEPDGGASGDAGNGSGNGSSGGDDADASEGGSEEGAPGSGSGAAGEGGADAQAPGAPSDPIQLPCAPGSADDGQADAGFAAAPGDAVPASAADAYAPSSEYPAWSYEGDTTYITRHYTDDWGTERFIAVIGELARQTGQDQDVYASIMIAQAILASDSGLSAAYLASNDLFGLEAYDEGTAATQAAVAMYQAQAPVHPLAAVAAGVTASEDGRVRGDISAEKAAEASVALVGTIMQPAEGQRQHFETAADSLASFARRLRILAQVPGAQIRQSQSEDVGEALAYLVQAGVLSEDDAAELEGVIEDYDLTRFDEALPYELARPLVYQAQDPFTGEAVQVSLTLADLVSEATSHLGVPYVWGGTTPAGFDCSGLVQYAYRHALGMDIPRTTYYQCVEGEDVDFSDLHMGDLLFFVKDGVAGHVAMYLGDGYYIEAPKPGDTVKVTSLDEKRPAFAKRLLTTVDAPAAG